MPDGRHAAREHDEPGVWRPTGEELDALHTMMQVQVSRDRQAGGGA